MNLRRILEIVEAYTIVYRKGPVVSGTPELVDQFQRGEPLTGGGVLEVNAFPSPDEAPPPEGRTLVDCHFVTVGVDACAAASRDELVSLLKEWRDPYTGAGVERLEGGPSYIEVGAVLTDQTAAFRLFGLGEALGLWKVVTPERIGITGPEADALAGSGFVMMTGLRPAEVVA